MEQIRKFTFDVGWVIVSSVATLFLGFLLRPVLARWLGAADLGLYQMVITVQGIAVLVATLGIHIALVKYIAEYKDDKNRISQFVSTSLIATIILGILTGFLLYILSSQIAGIFDMPALAGLLRTLAFVFPFTSFQGSLLGLFHGLRKMKKWTSVMILQSFLMVASTIAFVWLGFGIKGAIFGILVSVVGGCIGGLYLSRRLFRFNLKDFIRNFKKLISFGARSFAGNTVGLLANQADVIMIAYFLAAKDVGYYSIAVSLSIFFSFVPLAIQKITYPTTSEYWAKGNRHALNRMIDKSMKYSACILLPVGLAVGFFAEGIVTLVFGEDFIYAVAPLYVLLVSRVIRGSTDLPIGGSLGAIGRPELNVMLNVIAMVTNIGLNILLIPRLGILGAAMATTISLLLWSAIFFVLVIRMLRVKIDFRWFAQAIGLAGVGVLLFLGGSRLINPYIVGGIILCAYVVLVFTVFLKAEDRAIFKSLAYSMIFRR